MCYYNSRQLGLLQIRTTFVTIYDSLVITILDNSYYNLRQVLQFTTIVITIYNRYYNSRQNTPANWKGFLQDSNNKTELFNFLNHHLGCFWRDLIDKYFYLTQSKPFYVRWQWPSHLENICGNNVPQRLPNQAIRNGSEFTSTIPPHSNWWES